MNRLVSQEMKTIGDGKWLPMACSLYSGSLFIQLLFFSFIKAFISFPTQDGLVYFQGFVFLRKKKTNRKDEFLD